MSVTDLQQRIRQKKTPLALGLRPEPEKLSPKILKNFTDMFGPGSMAEAEALLARMYAASFAQKVPVFSDDVLIACRQGSYVFDPSIHHLTRNACHFIGCPIHGESAK